MSLVTEGDHSSLMIGYYKNTHENPVGGASRTKWMQDRVDLEG